MILSNLRALIVLAVLLPLCPAARAAELNGVQIPATVQADGKTLHLNGYGLRVYALLFDIYVGALYLEQPSTDPLAILASPETKLMAVTFLRDVSVEQARKSWTDAFANNCLPPCRLDPADLANFLAQVPAMRNGDSFSIVFTATGAVVSVNGQKIGTVPHRMFAEAMLATFLGPKPASQSLKQALLAGGAR